MLKVRFGALFLLLCNIIPSHSDPWSKDISRITQGVQFRFLHDLRPITHHWYHSFMIPVPQNQFRHRDELLFGRRLNESQSTWLANCLRHLDKATSTTASASRDILQPSPGTSTVRPAVSSTTVSPSGRSVCHTFDEEFHHLINVTTSNHNLLNAKYTAIQALLPSTLNVQEYGSKRGLLNVVGDVANSLFGVATDKELTKVANHVKQFADMAREDTRAVKQTLRDLSSFSSAVDSRIDNLVSAVRASALQSLSQYQNLATSNGFRFQFLQQLVRKATDINHAAWSLSVHLETFLLGMSMLSIGKLPAELVPPDMLRRTLHEVRQHMGRHIDPRLRLIHPNSHTWEYYKSCKFLYSYSNGHLIITVDIPFSIFESGFRVYEVQLLPLAVPNFSNGTMWLESDVHAIAFHMDRKYYFTLSDVDIAQSRLSSDYTPDIHNIYKISSRHCLSAIYFEWFEASHTACAYKISIFSRPYVDIISLGHDRFLLFNIAQYNVTCNMSYSEVPFQGCHHCVVTLQPGCTLATEDSLILSPETSVDTYPSHTNVSSHTYTVNRPLLTHFFSTEDLRALRGDTLLDQPPEIQLPNLSVFRNPVEDFIAQDETLHLSVEKVVESMKKNAEVLHSKADFLKYEQILSNMQGHNLFGEYGDYIIIVMLICGCLLMAATVALSLRVRSLHIAIALVSGMPKARAASVRLFYTPTPPQMMNSTSVQIPLLEFLRSIHESPSTQFYVITFLILILLVVCNIGYMLYRHRVSPKATTTLMVNFVNSKMSVLISLSSVAGIPSQCQLMCNELLCDVVLVAGLRPRLQFTWMACLKNTATMHEIKVASVNRISWCQYHRWKQILADAYCAVPLFLHNSSLFKPTIRPLDVVLHPAYGHTNQTLDADKD